MKVMIVNDSNYHGVWVGKHKLVFSYDTLVGYECEDGTRRKTRVKYSTTTTRHINQAGLDDAEPMTQGDLEAFVADQLKKGLE